jgi:NhaA family Na+:H+ antiporter
MQHQSLGIFKNFLQSPTVPGILLLLCVTTSLLLANSPAAAGFDWLLNKQIGISSGLLHLRYPILLWINDGLMAIFFLLVGVLLPNGRIYTVSN